MSVTKTIGRVKVGQLQNHPAQMRRKMDLQKMAELTAQMAVRGFDADRPLLIQKAEEKGKYIIIRGHRRRIAYSAANSDYFAEGWNGVASVDYFISRWRALVEEHGTLEAACVCVLAESGEVKVPAVKFSGAYKESFVLLWGDTAGEEPDVVGLALSLLEGEKAGIPASEAAKHIGQNPNYTANLIALARIMEIDPEFADGILAGTYTIGIAATIMSLKSGTKRMGAIRWIKTQSSDFLLVKRLTKALGALAKFNGLKTVLVEAKGTPPSRRNVSRSVTRKWRELFEVDEAAAWAAALGVAYATEKHIAEMPWDDLNLVKLWVRELGISSSGAMKDWVPALMPLLQEVSCETCPVFQLNATLLRIDLNTPRLPCRTAARVVAEKCLHGLAPNDPFMVRVPPVWAGKGHPGVDSSGANPVVTSFEDLEKAYAAQAQAEADDDEAERARVKREKAAEKKRKTAARVAAKARVDEKEVQATAEASPGSSGVAPNSEPESVEKGERPIDRQRALIAMYMALNEEVEDEAPHVLATRCNNCAHKLEASPTSDPTVPHCAWAERNNEFVMQAGAFVRLEIGENELNICRQYKPLEWVNQIPEHPGYSPQTMSREQMLWLITEGLRKNGNYVRRMFEFVTGRPFDVGDTGMATHWAEKEISERSGDLSNAQLFTLLVLLQSEQVRVPLSPGEAVSEQEFYVPTNNTLAQWMAVTEVVILKTVEDV